MQRHFIHSVRDAMHCPRCGCENPAHTLFARIQRQPSLTEDLIGHSHPIKWRHRLRTGLQDVCWTYVSMKRFGALTALFLLRMDYVSILGCEFELIDNISDWSLKLVIKIRQYYCDHWLSTNIPRTWQMRVPDSRSPLGKLVTRRTPIKAMKVISGDLRS